MLVHFLQKIQCFSYFFRFFQFFRFFGFFRFVSKQLVSEDPPKQLKREFIWVFVRKFKVVSFCFCFYETVLSVSVVSIQVRNTETNRKFFLMVSRNKPKQTRNRSCFGLFRFEPKFIFVCFEDTLTLSFILNDDRNGLVHYYIFFGSSSC